MISPTVARNAVPKVGLRCPDCQGHPLNDLLARAFHILAVVHSSKFFLFGGSSVAVAHREKSLEQFR